MWIFLIAPLIGIAIVTAVGIWRRPPTFKGFDPSGLRSVVEWRDSAEIASDVASDSAEQLRQLVGSLASQGYILSSSIDRAQRGGGAIARVDVQDRRFELRALVWRSGRWILWVDERGGAPDDSDDLRQLLTGVHRTLLLRHAEGMGWYRRERFASNEVVPAPTPFYAE